MSTCPFESVDYEALKDLNDGDAHLAIRKLDFPVMLPDSSILQGVAKTYYSLHFAVYGFGYDSSTDDYKVMRGCSYRVRDSGQTVVQVFSLKTGSWRTHQGLNYFDLAERGCLLNRVLLWLTYTDSCPTGSNIISFDLGEEKFQEMLSLPYHSWFSYIFSLGDCLCLYISGALDSKPTGFRIWMMTEYGVKDSWTEVVSSENLPEEYEYSLLTPLCILENGEVLMVKKGNYHSLVLFSSKEQTFRNVIRTQNKWKLDGTFYRETLVSPGTSSVADI
ncbi:hypothetical protein M0R45_034962 [Rubus argutus]|uniref:F-box associated beta-propeller type 1 domain-containing protein n=1 Tax=Rubus argutus TaxID=59490 RepID=A0AAW1VVF2_RUBAR